MQYDYEKVFNELSEEIAELEIKPFYKLFGTLYFPNKSLQSELEQIKKKYYKIQELVEDKSQYIERLYNVSQILKRPEIKILVLLKKLDGNVSPHIELEILSSLSEKQGIELDNIYREYNILIERVKNDGVNQYLLKELFTNNKLRNASKENRTIINKNEYWNSLKKYYYDLHDRAFLDASLTDIKKNLQNKNIIYASHTRTQLVNDLKEVRAMSHL